MKLLNSPVAPGESHVGINVGGEGEWRGMKEQETLCNLKKGQGQALGFFLLIIYQIKKKK